MSSTLGFLSISRFHPNVQEMHSSDINHVIMKTKPILFISYIHLQEFDGIRMKPVNGTCEWILLEVDTSGSGRFYFPDCCRINQWHISLWQVWIILLWRDRIKGIETLRQNLSPLRFIIVSSDAPKSCSLIKVTVMASSLLLTSGTRLLQ